MSHGQKLFQAITNADVLSQDSLIEDMRSSLTGFLQIELRASLEEAEESTQDAFLTTIEAIKKGALENPEKVASYLITSAKYAFLKMRKNKKPTEGLNPELLEMEDDESPDQFEERQNTTLLDEDRQRALNSCIRKLDQASKLFIKHLFTYPDKNAEELAKRFKTSKNNVWTKKSRIIKQLNECVSRYLAA